LTDLTSIKFVDFERNHLQRDYDQPKGHLLFTGEGFSSLYIASLDEDGLKHESTLFFEDKIEKLVHFDDELKQMYLVNRSAPSKMFFVNLDYRDNELGEKQAYFKFVTELALAIDLVGPRGFCSHNYHKQNLSKS